MGKWGEEVTFKFVELYRDNECLWHSAHPLYKNKPARETAILNIIHEMGLNILPADVKQKIKNLRSTYSQELSKINKSKKTIENPDNYYVPAMRWFAVMNEFLQVQQKPVRLPEDEYQEDKESWEMCYVDSIKKSPKPTPGQSIKRETDALLESFHSKPKRFRAEGSADVREATEDDGDQFDNDGDNEYYVFGRHIATQLMKLSTKQFVLAQAEIQTVLTQCRLKDLHKRTVAHNSYTTENSPNNNHDLYE